MNLQAPSLVLTPSPERTTQLMKKIIDKYDDPELRDAAMQLVAEVAPTEDENKFKHEAAWAAIEYAYTKTTDLAVSCKRYLGVASGLIVCVFLS